MKKTPNNNKIAPVLTDFLRTGMWSICSMVKESRDPDTGEVCRIFRYGNGMVIVTGELNNNDRDAFVIIQHLMSVKNSDDITGNIVDLSIHKGLKNPYDPKSINPIWDSIENLLTVRISIRPNKRGAGLSASFSLVSGVIESNGDFFLTSHDYREVQKRYGLYLTKIPLVQYFRFRSDVTRSLQEFLRTQRIPNCGYEISLLKLCRHIGYLPENVPLRQIWYTINKSIQELIDVGFIGKMSKRDKKRCRHEGGVIMFFPVISPSIKSAGQINDEIVLIIKDKCGSKFTSTSDTEYRTELNKLSADLAKTYSDSLKSFVKNYCEWIAENSKITFVSAGLFKYGNKIMEEFIRYRRDQGYLLTKKEEAERYQR